MSDKLTEEQMDQVIDRLIERLETDKELQKKLGSSAVKGLDPYLQKVGGIDGLLKTIKPYAKMVGIDLG
jgi:hypothetical protein